MIPLDCGEAKKLIREGRPDAAGVHVAGCEDCRAYMETFAEDAAMLTRVFAGAEPPSGLLMRTLDAACAEMGRAAARREPVAPARRAAAAAFAAMFAPLFILVNFIIARAADGAISGWLSPVAGNIFFAGYALAAVAFMGLAYGSLPLLFAAAGNSLRPAAHNGGATA